SAGQRRHGWGWRSRGHVIARAAGPPTPDRYAASGSLAAFVAQDRMGIEHMAEGRRGDRTATAGGTLADVRVDDTGITATSRSEMVLDVVFDGRRIWSFWLHRDGVRRGAA